MKVKAIELTDTEKALAEKIQFDGPTVGRDHDLWKRNGDLVVQLVNAFMARDAIPKIRLEYFTDAEHGSRGKSYQRLFENNGTEGEDILRHASFLKFLRYFMRGPDLPLPVIEAFSDVVESCGPVTSGDVEILRKNARTLTKQYSLPPHHAADEFYKLVLECGAGQMYADSVRRAVLEVKQKR